MRRRQACRRVQQRLEEQGEHIHTATAVTPLSTHNTLACHDVVHTPDDRSTARTTPLKPSDTYTTPSMFGVAWYGVENNPLAAVVTAPVTACSCFSLLPPSTKYTVAASDSDDSAAGDDSRAAAPTPSTCPADVAAPADTTAAHDGMPSDAAACIVRTASDR